MLAELALVSHLMERAWGSILDTMPEEERRRWLDDLFRCGSYVPRSTIVRDDAEAELAGDLAVITRERLGEILSRVARYSETDWLPPAEDPLSDLLRQPKSASD